MQIHEVQSATMLKSHKRVGRGGKRGKTAGRGTKGQKARAGHRIRPAIRDLIKKLPKRRGQGVSVSRFKTEFVHTAVLNVAILNNEFSSGDRVTPKILLEKALIEKKGNKMPAVKVLGGGTLDKKLTVRGCAVSASAKEAIEKVGGTAK